MLIQSDLRFLLPIQAKQQVVILGHYPGLAEAISDANGATIQIIPANNSLGTNPDFAHTHQAPIRARYWLLPLAPASVDHIIAPIAPNHRSIAAMMGEISRILKPGGWFFYGIHHPNKLSWLLLLSLQRTLTHRQEFHQSVLYGAYPGLHRPRYMIPLTSPGPAYHFYHRMLVPRSPQALIAQRLAVLLARLGLQRVLFSDFGFVAQRS